MASHWVLEQVGCLDGGAQVCVFYFVETRFMPFSCQKNGVPCAEDNMAHRSAMGLPLLYHNHGSENWL